MYKDKKGNTIQAMPLLEGKTNLETGTHNVEELIHCVTNGTLTLHFGNGAVENVDILSGLDYAFVGQVTITAGKFHIS